MLKNVEQQVTKPYEVVLDWRAYFKRFCEQHGGNPVSHGGRLLFGDGWSYSSTDYMGPEWAPPVDAEERKILLTAYWTRRRDIVAAEHASLTKTFEGLRRDALLRSVPLQQRILFQEENAEGKMVVRQQAVDLDFGAVQLRLEWLRGDVEQCDEKLAELQKEVSVET